jgi:hypothetical protein
LNTGTIDKNRITKEQVAQVIRLYERGFRKTYIQKSLNLSKRSVSLIVNGHHKHTLGKVAQVKLCEGEKVTYLLSTYATQYLYNNSLKRCAQCKIILNFSHFYNFTYLGKLRQPATCKTCRTPFDREKRKSDYLKNKEKIWEKNLYKDFKLTKEQYFDMGVQQNGCCAICKTKPKGKLVVDHCHTRGNVRGLLCNLCNAGIGFLKESEEIFLSALTYLKTR